MLSGVACRLRTSALSLFPRRRLGAAVQEANSSRSVPLALIKDVRAKSGAPIAAVKEALVAEEGNVAAALERLRRDGARLAALRAARETREGLVGLLRDSDAQAAAIVEVHCETDFVARTALFYDVLNTVANTAMEFSSRMPGSSVISVDPNEMMSKEAMDGVLGNAVAVLGENVQLGRVQVMRGNCIGCYVHGGTPRPEGTRQSDLRAGRIGAAVALSDSGAGAQGVADRLAMHVAAEAPQYLRRDMIPSDVLEKETDILMEAAQGEGVKPGGKKRSDDILRKMVGGRLSKWMADVVLDEQAMLVADEPQSANSKPVPVRKWLEKQLPGVQIVGFHRLAI